MAKRKTRATAGGGEEPRVVTEVEDDVAGGVATGAGAGATTGATVGGAAATTAEQMTQVVSDALNQMRAQLNNITETVGKVIEQKVDVGEQEAQGAGIAQASDTHRNLHSYMAWNAAHASHRMQSDMTHYGGTLQALTTSFTGAMQTLQTLIVATAANDETQQRSSNWRARCDLKPPAAA